jgi:hypothetical protein
MPLGMARMTDVALSNGRLNAIGCDCSIYSNAQAGKPDWLGIIDDPEIDLPTGFVLYQTVRQYTDQNLFVRKNDWMQGFHWLSCILAISEYGLI